ncbi:MAG: HD domain-containing protein [SAR324 cluster bacterium]|nr:HD domain-containing protein [SAR324 cluster bacterium]
MKSPLDRYKIRCPIHGNIPFSDRERQIIDHPFFQRLRHISQLGFASYVYPGATHSRFSHSLGAMHLAGVVFDHLVSSPQSCIRDQFPEDPLHYFRTILRFSALLHDCGHAPFSHSSEPVFPLRNTLDLPVKWYSKPLDMQTRASHEDFSIAIVFALSQGSSPLLSEEESRDICSLIDHDISPSDFFPNSSHRPFNIHPLLQRLVSGEVDVDRMDYLLRDSHYAGVSYGKFDLDRLIQGLHCTATEHGLVLTMENNVRYAYEDFLLARLHMFLQVYFHKTLLPFDFFLKQAFQERELDLQITGDLENFLMLHDDSVHSALWKVRTKKWASRIVFRKPPKRLFQFEHYHPDGLEELMIQQLKNAGIETLFLRSSRYLSKFSTLPRDDANSLLIRNTVMGKTMYLPVQKVSSLLDQYRQNADLKYLYCDQENYESARKILIPFLESRKLL